MHLPIDTRLLIRCLHPYGVRPSAKQIGDLENVSLWTTVILPVSTKRFWHRVVQQLGVSFSGSNRISNIDIQIWA